MRGTSTNAIRQPCGKPRLRGAHGAKTVRYDYVAWVVGYVCIASPATAVGATFQGLGDLPGGSFASVAFAVSPDGSIVVGESGSSFGTEAFLLESGMMTGLGDLPGAGFFSTGRGVSLGGTVVVGYSLSAAALGASPPWEAFRWESGVMTGLGDLPGGEFFSRASDVSADGSIVVGTSTSGVPGRREAFRWTVGMGMVGLGFLPGGNSGSVANTCSADGSVVVGFSHYAGSSFIQPFRWSAETGMVGLGGLFDLGGGQVEGNANGVSADGSVVVGSSNYAPGLTEAFRWTAVTGMVGLGDLPGGAVSSAALGVSADGLIVIGHSQTDAGREAFIWDATNGMRNLKDVLESDFGLDLTGWTLRESRGPSDNGLVVVGSGTNPMGQEEGWIFSMVVGEDDPPTVPPYDPPVPAIETNAVIIVHGWNPFLPATFNYDTFWVPLEQEIQASITAPGNWLVQAYDWVADASTSPLGFNLALNNAQFHGDFLGQTLAGQGFDHVHLIGHSAGSALIGRAALWLHILSPETSIHTTFLDPFSGVFVGGPPPGGYEGLYGGFSDWSDNYFSRDLSLGTELEDLPWSFNVDVTQVDPVNPLFSSHSWPRCFYRFTVSDTTADCADQPPCTTGGVGFPLSREASSGTTAEWLAASLSSYPVGQVDPLTLTCPSAGAEAGTDGDLVFRIRQDDPLNFVALPYETSAVGSVTVLDFAFTAMTLDAEPSSAWINIPIELVNPVNFVQFDVEFGSNPGARGLLTAYLDGIELGLIDEEYYQAGFNAYSLQSYAELAGAHTLSFRLDPFATTPSIVTVSNVATGRGIFTCASDLNVDAVVNVIDLIDLLLCFGQPATPPCDSADINGDGVTNVLDLIDLLLAFGTTCP